MMKIKVEFENGRELECALANKNMNLAMYESLVIIEKFIVNYPNSVPYHMVMDNGISIMFFDIVLDELHLMARQYGSHSCWTIPRRL